ncbi:BlaB/IND/MUS family subclass B1 metallo-beta-lactamase [Chitinophaga sp. Mgbs1]|uniref:beta-lactamase n=1 Tax=Chitinophaga solisilvae TaxID=1233460 RepID=A0A3S1B352_9BACT|nr:BlaB/IND/MUS family subclass B1 metallo-beta-lactamase [Chitinophaga solisilvae]
MNILKKMTTAVIGICCSLNAFAQQRSGGLEIRHLTGDYYIYTTWHEWAGKLYPANGMYVVTNKGTVIIDCPWDTAQLQPLLDSIEQKHHQPAVICIATHSHADRTGGFDYFRKKGIKTYSTEQTYQICRQKKEQEAAFRFTKDTVFRVGQHVLQTFFAGEGHTADNIVIWVKDARILYGGCLIKSVDNQEMGYIAESNLKAWPQSLRRLQQKYPRPAYIIPGHESWASNKSIIHTLQLLEAHAKSNP